MQNSPHITRALSRPGLPKVIPDEQIVLGDDAAALKSLVALVEHGMDKGRLLDCLYGFPRNESTFGELLRGLTDGAAKRYPMRIRRLASEIKNLNSPGWMYFEVLRLKRGAATAKNKQGWTLLWKQFNTLPQLLETYASFLDYVLSRRKKMRRHSTEKLEILNLMREIRQVTGRAHFGDIAALLNAAYGHAGKTAPYDDDDLNKLWINNSSVVGEPLILSD